MTQGTHARGGARKGAGRPPKPAEDRAARRVVARTTEAVGAELDAWAARAERPLSEMVIETALRAARRVRA